MLRQAIILALGSLLLVAPVDAQTGREHQPSRRARRVEPSQASSDTTLTPLPDVTLNFVRPRRPHRVPITQVWFTPNIGSQDMLSLFSNPERWAGALRKIHVFKFYIDQINSTKVGDCASCGQNALPNFVTAQAFSKLNSWGIFIGMETGAVKEWGCNATITSDRTKQAIASIQSNGGIVSYIAMDEPFIGGQLNNNGLSCNFNMQQSAAQTAQYIQLVHAAFPSVQVGDIEPYPYFSVDQLKDWINTLQADGVTLPFFHMDVASLAVPPQVVAADITEISAFCKARNIKFGIFFNALHGEDATSDQQFYSEAISWTHSVKDSFGVPEISIFQSWDHFCPTGVCEIPINLPDNDPSVYSLTRLVNDGLTILDPP